MSDFYLIDLIGRLTSKSTRNEVVTRNIASKTLVFNGNYVDLTQIINIMEEEMTFGIRVLNGFLRVMVFVLVGILLAVVVSLILAAFGFF